MRDRLRYVFDRSFTVLALLSVGVAAVWLAVVLTPILARGFSAVVFRSTAEFRAMQCNEFHRGDPAAVQAEAQQLQQSRAPVYALLDRFRKGIDVSRFRDEAKGIYRELGKQLVNRDMPRAEQRDVRRAARRVRNTFIQALETTDKAEATALLKTVLKARDEARFRGTVAERFVELATEYRAIVTHFDLTRRDDYAKDLAKVEQTLTDLFGPRAGEELPALTMHRYGATRWDRAQTLLDRLLWTEQWVADQPGQPLRKKRARRETLFAGTVLEPLFGMVERDLESMLAPRLTFYWQYFIDDSTPGHYFGGVGPEILGTVLLTLLAIAFALPLGVVSAAYLVEVSGDSVVVKLIRTCINTLAGVPSIVFGLFGLAFFVLWFLPEFGLRRASSIWAGALTLGLLVLPVMIRASEEAIRMVPAAWKEGALALGASRFRCFVTVTLPAALPGILTGLILSMSRAAGETAPILFTAAVALGPVPTALSQPTRTLSYGSYDLAVGDRVAMMAPHQQYGMVATLVILVLILNVLAIWFRARIARDLRGQ